MDFNKMTTEMAKRGKLIDRGAEVSLANATAQPQMSIDKMTELYMQMRYEERQQMILHLIGEQGMSGLQAARRIMAHAFKKYGSGQPAVGQPTPGPQPGPNPEAGQAPGPIPMRAPMLPTQTGMP